jgi:hypothetical protein
MKPPVARFLEAVEHGFHPQAAYGRIYQSLLAQSQKLAYIDTFMVLAIGAGIMFLLSFIIRKSDPMRAAAWSPISLILRPSATSRAAQVSRRRRAIQTPSLLRR